ncbi:unnamed protein product [Ixodes persulcatus]
MTVMNKYMWCVVASYVALVLLTCSAAAAPSGCKINDEDDDYAKQVKSCDGYSQLSDCRMVTDENGCLRCRCPTACPSIYCGLRCRRVLRAGACPYCDCRRGKQVYVLGKKPNGSR